MSSVERVDIVDGEDRVVGSATRAEMRSARLRHRATYILVFNPRGQLFVHRRTMNKDVYPGFYDVVVGGVVREGEGYDEGAARELEEELGIENVALRRLGSFRFEDELNQINGMIYSCTYGGPLRLQAEEIVSGDWLDLDVIFERAGTEPFCPDGVAALCHYLEILNRARTGRQE